MKMFDPLFRLTESLGVGPLAWVILIVGLVCVAAAVLSVGALIASAL